jgi:hypothetical protein
MEECVDCEQDVVAVCRSVEEVALSEGCAGFSPISGKNHISFLMRNQRP